MPGAAHSASTLRVCRRSAHRTPPSPGGHMLWPPELRLLLSINTLYTPGSFPPKTAKVPTHAFDLRPPKLGHKPLCLVQLLLHHSRLQLAPQAYILLCFLSFACAGPLAGESPSFQVSNFFSCTKIQPKRHFLHEAFPDSHRESPLKPLYSPPA